MTSFTPLRTLVISASNLGRVLRICTLTFALGVVGPYSLEAKPDDVGTVEGRVMNVLTGQYLANVRVTVDGSTQEAITDGNGTYRLSGLPAGSVQVRASYVGLAVKAATAIVQAGQVSRQDFDLTRRGEPEVVVLDKYTVVGESQMSAQTLALNEQRTAANIKNVVAFEELPNGSDGNLGDYIRFVPGVTLTYSGRAPSEASIRGLPTDMTNVTIDGGQVASVFSVQSRATSMFGVSMDNVSRIEVTKVPTPDMPATGLGGTVNIISKNGFERSKPLFTYSIYSSFREDDDWSFNKQAGAVPDLNTAHILPSADLSYILPINKKLGFTFSASQKQNDFNADSTTPVWDLVKLIQTSHTIGSSAQLVNLRSGRFGVDWKLGDNNIFNASIQYRGREAVQVPSNLVVNYGAGATGGPNYTQGAATAVGSLTQNTAGGNQINTNSMNTALTYKHRGDVWNIDGGLNYSRSSSNFSNTAKGYFYSVVASEQNLIIRGDGVNGDGHNKESLVPTSYTISDKSGAPVNMYDGSRYSLDTAASNLQQFFDEKGQARVDFERKFLTAVPFSLKAGLFVTDETSTAYNESQTFTFRSGASAADRQLGNYDLLDLNYSKAIQPILGQAVQRISPAKVYALYQAQPTLFTDNPVTTYTTYVNGAKILNEVIGAGYLRGDIRLFHNRLMVVGGVRYEHTADHGRGPLNAPLAKYQRDANGNLLETPAGALIPISTNALTQAQLQYTSLGTDSRKSYADFYPSLSATYSIMDNLLARFGYARTVGRPNLVNIIPSVSIPDVTTTNPIITVVNSGLKPWTANSVDFSLESYLVKDGFGSIGVFQKNIHNFFTVVNQQATQALLDQYGVPPDPTYLTYTIATRGNGGDATVRGVEFTYRQSLTFLPNWARGVQLFVNYTHSQLGGSSTADFTGFNPTSLSWGVNFVRPRFFVKLSAVQQGEARRAAVATSATMPIGTYSYQGAKQSVTLAAEYRIYKHISLFGSFSDFTTGDGFKDVLKRYAPGTPDYAKWQSFSESGLGAILGVKGEF